MKILKTIIITIIVSIMFGDMISCRKPQLSKELSVSENAALESTNMWVKLTDEEKYSKSWDEAASMFKNSIKRDKWINMLNSTRKPLGKILQRELQKKEYKTSLPGVPDGEYIIHVFKTSFENKKDSIETITVMKETNNSWKVVGYYIR